jgi:hypothetical protein
MSFSRFIGLPGKAFVSASMQRSSLRRSAFAVIATMGTRQVHLRTDVPCCLRSLHLGHLQIYTRHT